MATTHSAEPGRLRKDPDKAEGVRSVERAVELLRALNHRPTSTLHELHQDTGLPKASLIRFLRTFEGLGLVGHQQARGSYHLLANVTHLSSGYRPSIRETRE